MTTSAFGVDHGGISKSLKPQHVAALRRATSEAHDDGFAWKPFRDRQYAGARLMNHSIQDAGKDIAPRMTISRGMGKDTMKRMTRTRRADRDKNRKPIFATTVGKSLPSALRGSGKAKELYGQHLKAAKTYGSDHSRMISTGLRDDRTLATGMNQKSKARRIGIRNNNSKKLRVLP